MRRVEQQVIEQSHPQFRAMDALAFASKNLWNLANYQVRQSFLVQHTYLTNSATFHLLKETEAYQALPSKVANQVLWQLHQAWTAFFCRHGRLPRVPSQVHGTTQAPQLPAQNAGAQRAGV
jgi:putative transposase